MKLLVDILRSCHAHIEHQYHETFHRRRKKRGGIANKEKLKVCLVCMADHVTLEWAEFQ